MVRFLRLPRLIDSLSLPISVLDSHHSRPPLTLECSFVVAGRRLPTHFVRLEDEVAVGGHTHFEGGVLAVLLRPGSTPASSALTHAVTSGRRAGEGRTSCATRMAPPGAGSTPTPSAIISAVYIRLLRCCHTSATLAEVAPAIEELHRLARDSGARCAYRIVIWIVACPISSWIALIGAPHIAR